MEMRHRLNRYFARDPRSMRRRTEPQPRPRPSRLLMLLEGLLEEAPVLGPYLIRRRQRSPVDPWDPPVPRPPGDLDTPQFTYAWLVLGLGVLMFFMEPVSAALWASIAVLGAAVWYLRTLFSPKHLARQAFAQGVDLLLGDELRPAEAVHAFRAAREHQPRTYELGKYLAAVQAATGNWEEAVATVTDYLSVFEADLGARSLLADGLLKLGRPAEAHRALEQALKLHPEAADELAVLNQRAEILLALGRPEEALTLLRLYLPRFVPESEPEERPGLTPEEVEHHRLRAAALAALGRDGEAAEHARLVRRFAQASD